LLLLAVGIAIVAVDFRSARFDVLPDPLGWLLAADALRRLSCNRPAILSAIAGVLSLTEVHLPYRHVIFDPLTGRFVEPPSGAELASEHLRYDPLTGWRLALSALAVLAAYVALVALFGALAGRAGTAGERRDAGRLRALSWIVPLGWAAPILVVMAGAVVRDDGEFDPIWNGSLALLGLAGSALLVCSAVFLAGVSERRWALPDDRPFRSPWDETRSGGDHGA
jgi:hypothetical protein